MKVSRWRLWLIVVAAIAVGGAQTTNIGGSVSLVTPAQLTCRGITGPSVLIAMSANAPLICAGLDAAGFTVDTTVNPPVVHAVPPQISFVSVSQQPLTGTIDGTNAVFTLAGTPAAGTLEIWRNGVLQIATVAYNLSGTTITFVAGAIPQPGDSLVASYRQ